MFTINVTTYYRTPTSGHEGLREQKRRETHRRITEVALRLFIEQGYDATTLEMVAEAVGIARRTFFAYFKSKDAILLAWDQATWGELLDGVQRASPEASPLATVRSIMLGNMLLADDAHMRAILRVMRSSSALSAVRPALSARRESSLYEVFSEVWPAPERSRALRLQAVLAVGELRLAVEAWEAPGNTESLRQLYLQMSAEADALFIRPASA